MITDYENWWHNEGSGYRPLEDEDTEEFMHRVTTVAWLNGEFVGDRQLRDRTCGNCVEWTNGYCNMEIDYEDNGIFGLGFMETNSDFGCNKWRFRVGSDHE